MGLARLSAAVVAALLAFSAAEATATETDGEHWVGAWTNALGGPDSERRTFAGETLRMIATPLTDGREVRVRFSNAFGSSRARFDRVYLGSVDSGASLRMGTNTRLRFDGERSVAIPPGGGVLSDPVKFPVTSFEPVAISIDVSPRSKAVAGEHLVGGQRSFLAGGRRAESASGTGFSSAPMGGFHQSRYFLERIDVRRRAAVSAVVALGDSLTDGLKGGTNAGPDARYPDFLAHRLVDERVGPPVSLLNSGLIGATMLGHGGFTPGALARLRRDVPDGAGVSHAIVALGVNDLKQGSSWSAISAGYTDLIERLRRRGIEPILATVTPAVPWLKRKEEIQRIKLNAWIRSQQLVAVADFDLALRDPLVSFELAGPFSGDSVHPNASGYRAMAAAVPLEALEYYAP